MNTFAAATKSEDSASGVDHVFSPSAVHAVTLRAKALNFSSEISSGQQSRFTISGALPAANTTKSLWACRQPDRTPSDGTM